MKVSRRITSANWTSELRGRAGFEAFTGVSVADFECRDLDGALTRQIYGPKKQAQWTKRWPTYHFEVKATSLATRSFKECIDCLSSLQLSTVSIFVLSRWSACNAPRVNMRMAPASFVSAAGDEVSHGRRADDDISLFRLGEWRSTWMAQNHHPRFLCSSP